MKKLVIVFSTMFVLLFGSANGSLAASNTYTVKSGDTLYKIAKTYKLSVNQLKHMNNLKTDRIHPKQILKISAVKTSSIKAVAKAKPSAPKGKVLTLTATAYTANCSGCSGITATGINLKKNPNQKVISVDPNVIKLGTKVYVEGYGYAIAADKGSAVKGNNIDVFIPNKQAALNWGRKTVKVTILN